MAIGTHELLLIVRAQNQASALLGRVGRDVRRLQSVQDLSMRRAAIANRQASIAMQQQAQLVKILSRTSAEGRVNLQYQQALARNAAQQANVRHRIEALEIRRAGIARAETNIEVQRLRIMQQELNVERNLEKVEMRRQAIYNQIRGYGTQMLRNQQAIQRLGITETNQKAQVLERQIALNKANSAYMKAVRAGGPVAGTNVDLARQAAQLRLTAAQGTLGLVPGQRAILEEQAKGIRANAEQAQRALKMLEGEEARLAETTRIAQLRYQALEETLRGVRARGVQVANVERELVAQLDILDNELRISKARWTEEMIAVENARKSYAMLESQMGLVNMQLAEQDALLASQGAQRWATISRGVGHVGRVIQTAGLLGAAGLGAMAISAAHLNTAVMQTATQTGPVNASTQLIVQNSDRIQKAIIDTMRVVPANQDQLNDALYNIYSSMDTTFNGGIKLLKLFGQTWVAGGMTAFSGDVNDVADALITLGNNWGISSKDMAAWRNVANSTVATVRFGRLNVEQYTGTMNQLAPAFHGAHQSIEQMNGAIAFMTRLLPSQRMSAAGLARMMEIIGRFAARPASGFEDLARSIQDTTGNLLPLDKIISIFIQRFPKLQTSGVFLNNFFKMISNQEGTIQARRALNGLVTNFQLYQDTLENVRGDQNQFNRSLQAMEQSTGVRWAQFVNNMKALALELGTAVIPALLVFGKYVQRAADYFSGLSDETKRTIGQVAAFVAVGALLGGTILAVVGAVGGLLIPLRLFAGEAGMTTPTMLGMVAAAVALIGILQRYPHQVQAVTNALGGFRKALELLFALFVVNRFTKFLTALIAVNRELKVLQLLLLRIGPLAVITLGVEFYIHKDQIQKAGDDLMKSIFGSSGAQINDIQNLLSQRAKINATFGRDAFSKMYAQFLQAQGQNPRKMVRQGLQNVLKALDDAVPWFIKEYKSKLEDASQRVAAARSKLLQIDPKEAPDPRRWRDLAMSDAQIVKAVQHVVELQRLVEADKTNIDKIRAYHVALAALMAKTGAKNKEIVNDLLSAYAELGKATQTVSDATVLAMQRNIKHLEQIAKKSGDIKDYMAIQKAMQELEKKGTSEQVAAAAALIQQEEENARVRQQNAKEAEDKLKAHNQRMKELHQQNMENARDMLLRITENLQQRLESAVQENQSLFGQLFGGRYMTESATMQIKKRFGIALSPLDLLKDIRTQVADFRKITSGRNALLEKGAPQAFIDQLKQLGPKEQLEAMNTLSKASPGTFRKIVNAFNQGQKMIERESARDVRTQLEKWARFGKAVQRAIILGMTSENQPMQNAIMDIVKDLFPGLTKQAGKLAPKTTTHIGEINHWNIHPSTPAGTKTAINEARFAYNSRKRPLM